MSDLNKMAGTPWHIEKTHRKEGDGRRHRSRCIYYDCMEPSCKKRKLKCKGSAHCDFYTEKSVQLPKKNSSVTIKKIATNTNCTGKNARKRKMRQEKHNNLISQQERIAKMFEEMKK